MERTKERVSKSGRLSKKERRLWDRELGRLRQREGRLRAEGGGDPGAERAS